MFSGKWNATVNDVLALTDKTIDIVWKKISACLVKNSVKVISDLVVGFKY